MRTQQFSDGKVKETAVEIYNTVDANVLINKRIISRPEELEFVSLSLLCFHGRIKLIPLKSLDWSPFQFISRYILLMLDQRLNGSDISETGVKPFIYRGSNLPTESLWSIFPEIPLPAPQPPLSSVASYWSESSPYWPLIGHPVHSSHPHACYLIKLKHSHLSYHLKSRARAATLSFLLFTDIAQTWSPHQRLWPPSVHSSWRFKNHALLWR